MKGSITLSCGHQDHIRPHGYFFMLKGEDCDAMTGYHPSVSHMHWCRSCFIRALQDWPEDMMFEQHEEEEFFAEATPTLSPAKPLRESGEV